MKDLINFLKSQSKYVENFKAIHLGFFESSKGVSFYMTGAPTTEAGSDNHTAHENFPLAVDRYLSLPIKMEDPFSFLEEVKKEVATALEQASLPEVYTSASTFTLGWDDGDIEYIKGN